MKRIIIAWLLCLSVAVSLFAQETIYARFKPSGVLSLNPGWQFVQESQFACVAGTSSCTMTTCAVGPSCIIPTTTGSLWVVEAMTGNTASGVTISSVTGGSGSWSLCPTSSCHVFNSGHDNIDAAYNLSGSAGTTAITVNLSGNAVNYFFLEFFEILPPSGYVASLDTVNTTSSALCHVCTAPALTLTATDAVLQLADVSQPFVDFNGWSSPYITDYEESGIGLNVTNGAAPTFTQATTAGGSTGLAQSFIAMAFKSTAGSFTGPTPLFSLVDFTVPENGSTVSCLPSCVLTVPSTGSGHLLFLAENDATAGAPHISSVSGGGTWVTPVGCQAANSTGGWNFNCAYVLSSSSGVTSVTVTMASNTTSTSFAWYEISRTGGSFVVDAGPTCTVNAASSPGLPSGIALTLGGTQDVIFQGSAMSGGVCTASLYPWNANAAGLGVGKFASNFTPALLMLMNTANGTAPVWGYPGEPSATTGVCGLAFK